MALAADTIYEFQTGGSDNNGGGYAASLGGTDYSQQTASQLSVTDGATSGAGITVLTSVIGGFTAAMVGNVIYIRSGTNFTAGFYQIVTYTNGNTVTLDRTPTAAGAGSAGTGEVGGCRKFISSNSLSSALVGGNTVYIKAGTYAPDNSWVSQTNGSATTPIKILGYNTTRGDSPTTTSRPVLNFTSTYGIALGQFTQLRHLIITGAGTSLVVQHTSTTTENCKITNNNATSTSSAFSGTGASARLINCEITAPSCRAIAAAASMYFYGNYIHDSDLGINGTTSGNFYIHNIIDNCTTAVNFGTSGMNSIYMFGNTFYGAETPAGTGILATTGTAPVRCTFLNNIFYGFTTAVNWGANQADNYWDYNNFFNNTTDRTNVTAGTNDKAVNPEFINAPNGNFAVGPNLRDGGFPGTFPGSLSIGYLDIGAVQRDEGPAGYTFGKQNE